MRRHLRFGSARGLDGEPDTATGQRSRNCKWLTTCMKSIGGKKPLVNSRVTTDPLSRIRKTLRTHYKQKREHYGVDYPSIYDNDLRKLFSGDPAHKRNPTAAAFLSRIRGELRRSVARWTGEYSYTIDQVVQEMIERCRELKLRLGAFAGRCQTRRNDPGGRADHRISCMKEDTVLQFDSTMRPPLWHGIARRPDAGNGMSKLRVLVLVREGHVPPLTLEGVSDNELDPWKAEFDVCETLRDLGHEVLPIGVYDDLAPIRKALRDFEPDITFMMLEEFHGVVHL